MPDFGKSIFICSKPLQLLNCCSIIRKYNINDSEVHLITSGIHDSTNFINFIKNTNHHHLIKKLLIYKNYIDVINLIKGSNYESLFIESDCVSLYNLIAPLKKKYLSVFEEGIGTYIENYSQNFKGLKRLKWETLSIITGCGLKFGHGRKTDFIFIKYPELYNNLYPKKSKKTLLIPGFIEEIEHNLTSWEDQIHSEIGPISKNGGPANLILGTWGGFPSKYSKNIKNKNIATYYKAHPHDGLQIENHNTKIIKKSWIPAEACIILLSKKYSYLDVYHLGSSTAFYCEEKYKNVKFYDFLNEKVLRDLINKKKSLIN